MQGDLSLSITDCPSGALIRVYVAPRSSANRIVGEHNGEIKIALTAPPVDGAANRALLEYLARRLGVPKSAVSLVSGDTSRHKVIRVSGVSTLEVSKQFGLSG